jgi:hypothetical protein
MRIARVEAAGQQGVAVLDGDSARIVSDGGQQELVAIAAAGEAPGTVLDTVPLDQVRVLAPLDRPPSVRDFFAFEDHVKNSRAGQGLDVDPGWYEHPLFYFSNPAAGRWTTSSRSRASSAARPPTSTQRIPPPWTSSPASRS